MGEHESCKYREVTRAMLQQDDHEQHGFKHALLTWICGSPSQPHRCLRHSPLLRLHDTEMPNCRQAISMHQVPRKRIAAAIRCVDRQEFSIPNGQLMEPMCWCVNPGPKTPSSPAPAAGLQHLAHHPGEKAQPPPLDWTAERACRSRLTAR